MPQVACAVYKCTNNTSKLQRYKKEICDKHNSTKGSCGCPLPYIHYEFPSDKQQRKEWKRLIYRQISKSDKTLWSPKKNSLVCSAHFTDGKPTLANPYPTLHLGHNYSSIPTVRPSPKRNELGTETEVVPAQRDSDGVLFVEEHHKINICESEDWLQVDRPQSSAKDYDETDVQQITPTPAGPDAATTKSLRDKHVLLKQVNSLQQKCMAQSMRLKQYKSQVAKLSQQVYKKLLKNDDDGCLFYTGIPSYTAFTAVCTYAKSHQQNQSKDTSNSNSTSNMSARVQLKYYKKWKSVVVKKRLCLEDCVLLTLMKLRLGLLRKDLADRFSIGMKDVTYILTTTVKLLAQILKRLIIFYPQSVVSKSLPAEYRSSYKKLRCIMDCTEIFIQKPSNLKLQAATWSDYKHHNTLKALICITPQGSIGYVSQLWGGRASDRHIVKHCGFLNHIIPGDQILADRGFAIREELLVRGADLVIPPAAKGKAQMTSAEVAKTKRIANVRIHVERAIRRVKTFQILSQTMPISLLPLADHILFVCCAISNMKGPLVNSWDEVVPQEFP